MRDIRSWVALLIAITVCSFILIVTLAMALNKIPTTAENAEVRQAIILLVSNMAGVVSGWLLRGSTVDNKPPPKESSREA
jgi:choline-glycine betaine transporter